MTIHLRSSQQTDIPFLREMLYEAVFWQNGPNTPSFNEGLSDPEVGKALINWGERKGDIAVLAQVDSTPAGAAWFRFYNDDNFIRGYIRETIPTLVIAVHRDYRRKGIGEKIIDWLIDYASNQNIKKISLMVSKDNHALNLYRKCGFTEYADKGEALLMVRKI